MIVEKISMVDALNMEMKELMESREKMIIQALENASKGYGSGYVGDLWGDTLELIYKLKNEVSQYRSSYEHIDAVHTSDFEHFSKTVNEQKAEIKKLQEELSAAYENRVIICKQLAEQKAEIERLTEIRDSFRQEVITLNNEKLELQKQVDELKFDKELLQKLIDKREKDTAKEILQELYDQIDENTPKWVGAQIKIIAERKGVEVE